VPALSIAAFATSRFESYISGTSIDLNAGFLTSPSARATCSRHSAPVSRASLENFRSVSSAAATSAGSLEPASAAAATMANAGSFRFTNGRITSIAACPRSTASAETAAMRTALSGSFNARSTPGSQRSASAGPADSATFRARARTSALS
jgi:hypothetical protein